MPERGGTKRDRQTAAGKPDAEGARGEALTAGYLEQQGYTVQERNYRCRSGEIDLIVRQGSALAFVEVKTRTSTARGEPREYVTAAKQRRLRSAAMHYLMLHPEAENLRLRFDVAEVIGETVRYTENAFE